MPTHRPGESDNTVDFADRPEHDTQEPSHRSAVEDDALVLRAEMLGHSVEIIEELSRCRILEPPFRVAVPAEVEAVDIVSCAAKLYAGILEVRAVLARHEAMRSDDQGAAGLGGLMQHADEHIAALVLDRVWRLSSDLDWLDLARIT